ncbi:MAG TPA: hypothetical protein PKD73_17010 [Burkholderiaceae bacterium]|jgi:hypothetical protein|nr:hypothetical protein [Burkholderiaceae bacterium]
MKASHIALAACIAAFGTLAQAEDKAWNGTPQNWAWPAEKQCRLQVTSVSQPNESQPIHLTVVNRSDVRVQYSIRIRVSRSGQNVFDDKILVDNANAGETSERPTAKRLSGTLNGTRVTLTLLSCSVRS